MTFESHPQVTAIITTYRRPELLKKSIASVLNQTYKNLQVCIYDNASNDGTEEVVKYFSQKDPRIKYHKHEKNIGMIENYKYALANVNTPFFSFLSDDDYLLPHFYESALEGFLKYPDAAISACGIRIEDENGSVLVRTLDLWDREGYYSAPNGLIEMLTRNGRFFYPIGVLFQHKHISNIKPDWNNPLRWDTSYILQICARFPLIINKTPSGVFIAHSGGYSYSHYKQMLESGEAVAEFIKSTYELMKNLIQGSDLSKDLKKEITELFVVMLQREIDPYISNLLDRGNMIEILYVAKGYYSYFFDGYAIYLLKKVLIRKSRPAISLLKKIIKKIYQRKEEIV